jgi:hypothetical protein
VKTRRDTDQIIDKIIKLGSYENIEFDINGGTAKSRL